MNVQEKKLGIFRTMNRKMKCKMKFAVGTKPEEINVWLASPKPAK